MKRIFLLLLILFVFSLSKPLKTSACQYGNCDPNVYDCTNSVNSFQGANLNGCNIFSECQNKPCCAEIIPSAPDKYTVCWQEKNQPTPAVGCPEGTLGCPCKSTAPVCDGTLIPVVPAAGNCICSNIPQNPCIPGTEECQCRPSAPRCESGLKEVDFLLTCTCKKYSLLPTVTPWNNPCIKPGDPDGYKKIPTAIGCIDYTNTISLTKSFLTFSLEIGGGIAFLLMIFGSFMIITSSGNPERQQAGKEMISSAIMGLLLILMSVFILQLIGVKILVLPGFG